MTAGRNLSLGPRGVARRLLRGWVACAALFLLALPLGLRVESTGTAVRFLGEFLTDGALPWLSAATLPPVRESQRLQSGAAVDVWRPRAHPPRPGLVLVHGLTPEGKDTPRLRWAADLFARTGFVVAVPDLPAMRAQRLRPADARVVSATIAHLSRDAAVQPDRLAVVGISVGAAPAVAAALQPEAEGRVRLVVTLGGYAEARELIRYFTTGAYRFGAIAGRVPVEPALAEAFLAANLDLIRDPSDRRAVAAALGGQPLGPGAGPEARAVLAVLANRDAGRVDALLAALPRETQALLEALSPAHGVARLRARVLIVHGRGDPAIPYTESLRLAEAARAAPTRLVLVDLLGHVEGRTPTWRRLRDLVRLAGATYEVMRR